jgi:hypothetical protein
VTTRQTGAHALDAVADTRQLSGGHVAGLKSKTRSTPPGDAVLDPAARSDTFVAHSTRQVASRRAGKLFRIPPAKSAARRSTPDSVVTAV